MEMQDHYHYLPGNTVSDPVSPPPPFFFFFFCKCTNSGTGCSSWLSSLQCGSKNAGIWFLKPLSGLYYWAAEHGGFRMQNVNLSRYKRKLLICLWGCRAAKPNGTGFIPHKGSWGLSNKPKINLAVPQNVMTSKFWTNKRKCCSNNMSLTCGTHCCKRSWSGWIWKSARWF